MIEEYQEAVKQATLAWFTNPSEQLNYPDYHDYGLEIPCYLDKDTITAAEIDGIEEAIVEMISKKQSLEIAETIQTLLWKLSRIVIIRRQKEKE